MKMTRTALIATLCLALPLLAGEDEKQDRRAADIAKRDADGDGRLDAAEFGGGREIFDPVFHARILRVITHIVDTRNSLLNSD